MTIVYDELRSRLMAEQKRLLDEIAQLRLNTESDEDRREGSPFGKREEEATESLELEKRLAMEKRIREQLADIDNTMSKFDSGTYGLCESCGKPIEAARLEALPAARQCMNCKALQAKNAKSR